jgi:hypothetical protein
MISTFNGFYKLLFSLHINCFKKYFVEEKERGRGKGGVMAQ